jgi:hypothetical protein
MIRTLALTALIVAAPLAATADEVWSMPSGNQIVYERDAGTTAILSYKPEVGLENGYIFVPGLGGKYEGRGTYQGYWVEVDGAGTTCAAALVDAEGKTWGRWGAIEVKFAKPGFPSAITLTRGSCFGPAKKKIKAKPVVGAGLQ